MNGEVIKSFLVGLGFGVDESSLANFNKAIASASARVTALYASIQVAAAGIFWGISRISEGFEQMGYEYRIIAPAINKALILRRELLNAYRAAGTNIVKVVQQAVLFNLALKKTQFALEAIYKSVAAKFFPLLIKQMDAFRAKLYANMPKIQGYLERFVKFIFKAFEATVILGQRLLSILGRVYDFFADLDKATDGWSTKIIAAVAAWQLLNLSFLATPLGMIITGLIAILALFDDFKTWQEGGKSLFDWSAVAGIVTGLIGIFENFLDVIKAVIGYVSTLFGMLWKIAHLDFAGAWADLPRLFSAALGVLDKMWERIKGIFSLFRSGLDAAFSGATGQAQYFDKFNFATPPVNPNQINNRSNVQTLNQQTNINVQSTANAEAVGNHVLSGQARNNQDLSRNLKSAVQ